MGWVLAILKAIAVIPVLVATFDEFVAWYVESRIAKMKVENREAIKKAIETNDQRPVENVIGSPSAGEPSGIPGSTIVDQPPSL